MDTFGYSDADMVDTAPANDAVWPGRASAPPGGSVAKSGCMVKCLTYHVDGPDGKDKRVLLHEENVVLTATGCELLTRRAPREIPVIE